MNALKRFFKKLLWIVVILVALDLGIVYLLPRLAPMDKISAQIKEQAREKTGRTLDFQSAAFVFWPNLGVEMKQVTLSNPAWAKEKNMLSLGRVNVALAVIPLLERHVVVKKFTLDSPVIYLETGPDGRKNWEFSGAAGAGAAEGGAKPATGGGMAEGFDFRFGEVRLNNGKLVFADLQKGSTLALDDINLEARMPDLKSPLDLKGSLVYLQKRADIALKLEKPAELLNGKSSAGSLSLKTEDLSLKTEGAMATQGALFKGQMELETPVLAKAIAWAGGSAEKPLPFQKVSFSSLTQLNPAELILKSATLTLDDVRATGDVRAAFSGKPSLTAQLSLNKLNLDRFTGGDDAAAGGAPGKPAAQSEGWDTTPLDLSGLKAVNANLQLKTEGFSLKGVDVGPSLLTVVLQDGNLRFKSSEASLFGGAFSSDATLNTAPATPTMAFTFDMKGVQAKPVLETFAHFKKLSGAADARIAVTGAGNSQKALISSLNGNGSVMFKNGSLEGIDLVNIAKLVQKHLSDMGVGEGKTDFVELGGTFTLSGGVAHNTDLKMKGPLVQATGQGQIDLPQKYIQYRVIPVLTASSAVEGASGLAVPVDIKGPFSNIKVKPDFASIARDLIQHPENVKETVKNVKEQIKPIQQNIKELRQDLKKDPAKALQNLLQGGGLFGAPQQPQQPQAPAEAAPPAATEPPSPAPPTP